ncbi:hypothetical protein [Noviherbaspirillum denitrificans]|nr:hypothetical protein [Noviherbaspirillum denitrificans]
MSKTLPVIAVIAALASAALAALPGHAAESKAGRPGNAASARHQDATKAAKGKRGDKEAPRRIVTYNLFQDPVFKLNGALADKRQLGAPTVHDKHAQLGHALKAEPKPMPEPDTSGIGFGCSDKPFRPPANMREVTACYKHNVDRSWKAQTYLSREYNTEGMQKWGGGLAVRYAY